MIAKEIVSYLAEKKKAGNKKYVLVALDAEHIFRVSERCGAKKGQTRYPLICQAMKKATEQFSGVQVSEKCPSSTFAVEYDLSD